MIVKVHKSVDYIRERFIKKYYEDNITFESILKDNGLFIVINIYVYNADLSISVVIEEYHNYRLIHAAHGGSGQGLLGLDLGKGRKQLLKFFERMSNEGIEYEYVE